MANAAAAAPASPGIIRADLGGTYEVTAGDSTDSYASLRDALDAALPTVATREKTATLRDPDTGELNGAWRWLPATDVEPSAVDGVRIDAAAIREMAASLNARPGPVPIDGGPTPAGMLPSDVHGTAYTGGGTPANGWAHWAVVVEGPGADQAKLYLYAELVPEVARELDAGRIATGSVHFGYASLEGEAPRGVELISHALTNDPAVKTLAPANSVRNGAPLTVRRGHQLAGGVMRASAKGQRSMKTSIAKASNLRGPALDKLTQVCALLGVDINAEIEAECWDSPTDDAIRLIKQAASLEKVLEGAPATPAMPVTSATSSAARADAPPTAVDQAAQSAPVAGLADETAKDAWITQIMAALTQAGLGDGTDANASLSVLQGAADKIKGAMAVADAPADPTVQMGADRSAHGAALEQMRAELASLRTEVTELRPLREEKRTRDHADYVTSEAKRRGVTLVDGVRSKLLKMPREAVDAALDLVAQPPSGVVMPFSDAERSGGGGGAKSFADIVRAEFLPTVRAENAAKPRMKQQPEHYLVADAQRRAAAKYPHLVPGATVPDAD